MSLGPQSMNARSESDASVGHPPVQTGGDTASASAGAYLWILNGWQDLLLFVATPLLIIPLIAILQGYLTVADIALYVVSFGALGHHLPGMLRAYGDRELFARFRARFIIAPLFLLAISVFFAHRNLNGLSVMVLLWGVWHGAAQVYGFLRIYDAKVKSFSPITAKLDMAMCVAWFGLGLLQSPDRMDSILRAFYSSGGSLIPGQIIHALQATWLFGTGTITVAFLANLAWQWRYGRPPSSVKLMMMISSFGFWWYAMIGIHNIILGVAMFEVFHDVQYLGIVWVYNVKRVQTGHRVGAFTRFLFRRSWFLAGLYVGLVVAYGCINLFGHIVDMKSVKLAILALVTTSTFLHFYYDGFIWKVREKATREGLGLSGGLAEQGDQPLVPSWLRHGLYWSLFVVPVAMLATAELRGVRPSLETEMAIVDAVPKSANAQNHIGVALAEQDRPAEAVLHFQHALRLNPRHDHAPKNLGGVLQQLGRSEEAVPYLHEALKSDATNPKVHYNLGNALRALGRYEDAVTHHREVLRSKPDDLAVHGELGIMLADLGQLEEAKPHLTAGLPEVAANFTLGQALSKLKRYEEALPYYNRVLQLKPKHAKSHRNLGAALAALGRFGEAVTHYQEAVRLDPKDAQAHIDLATNLEKVARYREAVVDWKKALELVPDNVGVMNNLAWLLATCPEDQSRDGKEAVRLAEAAARLSEHKNALVLGTLAASHAEAGNFKDAVIWQKKAVELAPQDQRADFSKRLDLYEAAKPFRQRTE